MSNPSVLIKTRTLQNIRQDGFPELKWKVLKIVPQPGITIFGGASGSYKTWVAQQLALACSTGTLFLFHFETTKCGVLYCDEENGDITLPNRFDSLIDGHELSEDHFEDLHISTFQNIKLDDLTVVAQLKQTITQHNIKLIIIDSMVRCMIGQEDKSSDVRVVFDNLKQLLKQFSDLSIVILHHTKKSAKRGGINTLRGSGDFAAFADVVLMFDSRYQKTINIEVVKNRHIDLAKFNKFSIEIQNPEEGGLAFRYSQFKEANLNVIEDCKTFIVNHLTENNLKTFLTKDILNIIKEQHNHFTFYEALKLLQDDGVIVKKRRGVYDFLGKLISEEEEVV